MAGVRATAAAPPIVLTIKNQPFAYVEALPPVLNVTGLGPPIQLTIRNNPTISVAATGVGPPIQLTIRNNPTWTYGETTIDARSIVHIRVNAGFAAASWTALDVTQYLCNTILSRVHSTTALIANRQESRMLATNADDEAVLKQWIGDGLVELDRRTIHDLDDAYASVAAGTLATLPVSSLAVELHPALAAYTLARWYQNQPEASGLAQQYGEEFQGALREHYSARHSRKSVRLRHRSF